MNLGVLSQSFEKTSENSKQGLKRKFFVNSKIQFSRLFNLILFQIISFASILVTGSWILFFKIDQRVTMLKEPLIVKTMIIFLIVLNLGVFIWSVLFLRSVAGPVKKIQIILKNIADGNVLEEEVKFRKNDFFTEILPDLNAAIKKINSYKK
ncbi:MAG: hypothetical protein RBR08_00685 [Desulforegulaceae bacterium]|nr:hypothetical protein [Desulforegulaceae bacterium]